MLEAYAAIKVISFGIILIAAAIYAIRYFFTRR